MTWFSFSEPPAPKERVLLRRHADGEVSVEFEGQNVAVIALGLIATLCAAALTTAAVEDEDRQRLLD